MKINIDEIYKTACSNPEIFIERLSKDYVLCNESGLRTITLVKFVTNENPILMAAATHDMGDAFFGLLKSLAVLHFEAGRLYGRQEIVNETLEEIK